MKLLNHDYKNYDSLIQFITNNKIEDTNHTFIQIFYSEINDDTQIITLKDKLNNLFPNASIMGTSTAGVIENKHVEDNKILISFSIFEKSITSLASYSNLDAKSVALEIKENLVKQNTKLLVIFANTFTFNANYLIKELNTILPNMIIAGGNSGDDFAFEKGLVFSNKNNNADAVVTAIHSDDLKVSTNYLLNWQTIGKNMTITKCHENIIYEIDNVKAIDIYKKYLGEEVARQLPESGIEFPLIFSQNDIQTARAPIALGDDGSIIVAGNINKGTSVKFGFANIEYIEENNLKSIEEKEHFNSEGMYIYSCSTRKKLLGEYLDDELELLSNISDASGFMTYGEFYHDENNCINSLLNITTTYITLNENETTPLTIINHVKREKSKQSITLKALTNLVEKTTYDLRESLYYLKQFKNAMYSSLIFSSADKKGRITHVNENFEKISGYKEKELLGKTHGVVRSPEMKDSFFKKMWSKLNNFESWKGVLKNRKKDGSSYFVLAQIFPILKIDGSLKEYISLRHDITSTEKRRERLEGKVTELNSLTEDKEALLSQYSSIIDSFASSYRFNLEFNLTYANEVFTKNFSSYNSPKELKLQDIVESEYYEEHFDTIKKTLDKKDKFKGIITYNKGSELIYMDTTISPILDKHKNIIEYMVIEYEITNVLKSQQEVIDTQKDIIFTMGEIGETRSKETGNHVKRVAEYSKILALLSGLSDKKADILKMASPMHDIGKVGIPDHILNKPGKFTPDEWEIMKTHSELGYSMLKGSNREILKVAASVARYHHEKWDGSGYPEGLKADEIPIEARITAVADVFDALGSDRVYKRSWELDKIYELLKNEKGKHFDPILIDLFFQHKNLFLDVRAKYKDEVI